LSEESEFSGMIITVFGIFAINQFYLVIMFIKIGNLEQLEYNGIQEMAAYGLHSDVFKMLTPFLKKEMHILDFGCGKGAFSQRLVDAGMKVDGCDIDTDQIKAKVDRKITLDLNKGDLKNSVTDKYDLIVALEIIEHLQNPWKYLADCMELLKDGGIIVLSTPNIASFPSRLRFFMRGTLLAFEKSDLKHGHITPLSYVQLENMFDFFKLEVLKKGYAGPIPMLHFFGLSTFSIFRNSILPLFYPFMSGPKRGRALVYILKKT
jgi:2-polyprenyl-3-methyl-5-hydroxy-6-metoxy-1,4-benzoquinol methylase